jgi:hypothetical protein
VNENDEDRFGYRLKKIESYIQRTTKQLLHCKDENLQTIMAELHVLIKTILNTTKGFECLGLHFGHNARVSLLIFILAVILEL